MENEIELNEKRAMIYLPENAVDITINCKVYEDGNIVEVSKQLKLSEIQSAFMDAEQNYIEDDDVFVLTDSEKQRLARLEC